MAKKEKNNTEGKSAKKKTVPTAKLPFEKKQKRTSKTLIGVDLAGPKMVSFSIMAVIPTQQFGNIQPKIEVTASTYQEAKDFVTPMLKDLYETYSENLPAFMREKITVTERQVESETAVQTPPAPKVDTVKEDIAKNTVPANTNTYTPPEKVETVAGHSVDSKEVPFGPETKSEAYLKAENSIASASTMESLDLIQKKVNESVKIDPKDKPFLDTLILKKKKTIPMA